MVGTFIKITFEEWFERVWVVGMVWMEFVDLMVRLYYHHWAGLIFIVIGCGVVGMSSIVFKNESGAARSPLLGDVLVVLAQILAAIQFVVDTDSSVCSSLFFFPQVL